MESAIYWKKMYKMTFVENQLKDFRGFLKVKYALSKVRAKLIGGKLMRLVDIEGGLKVEQAKAREVEKSRLNMTPIIESRARQEAKPDRAADVGAPVSVGPTGP